MILGAILDIRHARRFETIGSETISQNPSEPLIQALGGMPAAAGVAVTERSAEGIPVVFACDRVIKQDVAKTPLKLKRRNADGTRADDPNHPVYFALHELANPTTTAYEFKEQMQGWLNLWGSACAEIIRKRNTVELWPLEPWRMQIDIDSLNRLRYAYRMQDGKLKTWIFDPANPPIFHLRQNCQPWYQGRGPVRVLREAMGIALATRQYQARFYGQGGHPRIALSTSAKLTDGAARRIRNDVETLTVGEHNWHRVLVMDHDLKPVDMVMPHRDAQFVDQLKLGRDELCGAFRVPPHKVANLTNATFSNVEHMAIEYVGDCLMPHFVCWQQAIARDLLNPKSFNTHFAVFVVDSLVRGDFATLTAGLHTLRNDGVVTANGVRKLLDMDDQISDADGGNLYLVQGAMMAMNRDPAAMIEGPMPTPVGGVN